MELTPDARSVCVRLRNYSQEQREFLAKFVEDLVRNGLAYQNPTSAWACAPVLVPKPGSARFRFTVDLRPVNKFTVRHQFLMPNLEHDMTKLVKAKVYATFDFSHGYWQFPLERSSQELQFFITPDGIYSLTTVMHGTTNAVTYLQSTFGTIVNNALRKALLYWLHDALLHHTGVEDLLKSVQTLFGMCARYNIKLHPAKCILYVTSIRGCGRLVSSDGTRFDPRRMEGLVNMESPTYGSDLQQFLCALQWLKHGIPQFTELVSPLHKLMELLYAHVGKRTKRAVTYLRLEDFGWNDSYEQVFKMCKDALINQVTIAHRDEEKLLCIYTDASDSVWSGILTQVPFEDLVQPHEDQRHDPLGFLSGRFDRTQSSWSILEKEAYAVMATLEHMHWLASVPSGFDLFTDHNNLVFHFDALSVVPDLSQTSLRKVLRWTVHLSAYNYTCLHIKCPENVWADLLSLWSAPTVRVVRRLVKIPELTSSSAEDFGRLTPETIKEAQAKYENECPLNLELVDDLWCNPAGAKWIPNDASDLQLRLCIIAHTGPSGHRTSSTTERTLRDSLFWSTMSSDIRTLVRACIHCFQLLEGGRYHAPTGWLFVERNRTTSSSLTTLIWERVVQANDTY